MAEPPPPSAFDFDPEWAAENKSPAIIATIVIVTVLETMFTAARLYVRGGIMKKLQLDDYIIIVAVVSLTFRSSLDIPAHLVFRRVEWADPFRSFSCVAGEPSLSASRRPRRATAGTSSFSRRSKSRAPFCGPSSASAPASCRSAYPSLRSSTSSPD